MNYSEAEELLGSLETFDPAVFRGDSDSPQDVCDLVMALALAYNDLRDTTFGLLLLREVKERVGVNITPSRGLATGLWISISRIQIGFLWELMELLGKSDHIVNTPRFQKIIQLLSKPGRIAWSALLNAAHNKSSSDPLTKALVRVRNNVAFHYNPIELRKNYSSIFLAHSEHLAYQHPLLSRGDMMQRSRFYFADAAAESYIVQFKEGFDSADKFSKDGGILTVVNLALYQIVTRFIQSRSAWQEYRSHA